MDISDLQEDEPIQDSLSESQTEVMPTVISSEGSAEKDDDFENYDLYRLDYECDGIDQSENGILAAGGEVLQPGDHVYMWCTLYQHHGIILDAKIPVDTNEVPSVLIAEFTNVALFHANTPFILASTASGATSGGGVTGGFRFVRETEPSKWHKVKYHANPLECTTWRPGTCSTSATLAPKEILLRVQFLHDCRHLLPEYHLLSANCETVAVWCVTGKWETLQYQQTMKLSQVLSVGLLPAIPGVGMVAAGLAFWHSNHIQSQWKQIADGLNKDFQWYAMGRSPRLAFHES